jgi:ABC-type amino acid transport substrate-binding protein
MKSALLILLFYYLFLFDIHAESASPGGSPTPTWHKLTVGVYRAAPFNIRQADGSWTGISVDLWREIAADLKVDFEWRTGSMP